jgi:hypothetical protein
MEGVWSLLRSWLRLHRGISQRHLPFYLSFFQFVHNARVRRKGLLPGLLGALVTQLSETHKERFLKVIKTTRVGANHQRHHAAR